MLWRLSTGAVRLLLVAGLDLPLRCPTAHAALSGLQPPALSSRRIWIQTLMSSALPNASKSLPSITTDDQHQSNNAGSNLLCDDGSLAPEQAIVGAYENECMNLPAREIPVQKADGNLVVLNIQQRPAGAGSTGLAVWNSSLLLARLLQGVTRPQQFWENHPTVIELGCGTGVVSLAAAVLGASHVMATDGNTAVVQLAQANAVANQHAIMAASSSAIVQTEHLTWGWLDAVDYSEFACLVIGSELTYNPAGWPLLAETMATLLRPDGLVIYLSLGHAGFSVNGEVDGFLSVAVSRGLAPVARTDPAYPFAIPPEQWLYQTCRSLRERAILDDGVRVVVLRRKAIEQPQANLYEQYF
jgi:SAM-dependent methyltransferase